MAQAPKGSETRASQTKSAATTALPYRVLARKYRPQTFSQLIGQDAMVQTLANAIRRERLAHAFLMTGVRGVGKTSTARMIDALLEREEFGDFWAAHWLELSGTHEGGDSARFKPGLRLSCRTERCACLSKGGTSMWKASQKLNRMRPSLSTLGSK